MVPAEQGDLVSYNKPFGGGDEGLAKIEITKDLKFKIDVSYAVSLLPLVDKLKAKLPAWMQTIVTGAEQKYEQSQTEQAPQA